MGFGFVRSINQKESDVQLMKMFFAGASGGCSVPGGGGQPS